MVLARSTRPSKQKMKVIIVAILAFNCIELTISQEKRTCSVIYDVGTKKLVLDEGKKHPYVAWATFKNEINQTG